MPRELSKLTIILKSLCVGRHKFRMFSLALHAGNEQRSRRIERHFFAKEKKR
jgi:hypothetical protein